MKMNNVNNKSRQKSDEKEAKKKRSNEHAGSLMVSNIPVETAQATIGDVESLLLKHADKFETINYIYVTDALGLLVGVISMKEIFRLPKFAVLGDVMTRRLVTVRPRTDQERVALLAIKHNLKAIPVINAKKELLGVVPSDVILQILHQESIEDALHSVGIRKMKDPVREVVGATSLVYFTKRLPWLMIGLFGGIAAAFVVGFFEHLLTEMILLAAFIPMVVYMADAVGAQSQTIFVRSLVLGRSFDLEKYLRREMKVTLALALVLGVMAGLLIGFWWQSYTLALIIGTSFVATIIVASAVAIFLPWLSVKLKYDPAVVSGPMATVLRDILSIFIYFSVSYLFIQIIGL
jgi:magnesium transporter